MDWPARNTPSPVDRYLMQVLLVLSSSDPARTAAAAWLAAFDAALAGGAPEPLALERAAAALGPVSGAAIETSLMLAVHDESARPPPILAG